MLRAIPCSNSAYNAWIGFKEHGYEVRLYTIADCPDLLESAAISGKRPEDKMSFGLLSEKGGQ